MNIGVFASLGFSIFGFIASQVIPPVLLQHAALISYAVRVDLQLLTQESIVTIINFKIFLGFVGI